MQAIPSANWSTTATRKRCDATWRLRRRAVLDLGVMHGPVEADPHFVHDAKVSEDTTVHRHFSVIPARTQVVSLEPELDRRRPFQPNPLATPCQPKESHESATRAPHKTLGSPVFVVPSVPVVSSKYCKSTERQTSRWPGARKFMRTRPNSRSCNYCKMKRTCIGGCAEVAVGFHLKLCNLLEIRVNNATQCHLRFKLGSFFFLGPPQDDTKHSRSNVA